MKKNEEGHSAAIVIINQTTGCHIARNESAKPICCL